MEDAVTCLSHRHHQPKERLQEDIQNHEKYRPLASMLQLRPENAVSPGFNAMTPIWIA